MTTPIYDFVQNYAASGTARLHMPGHKGQSFLGCEALDLTEVKGTGGLIEAGEANAAALFGSAKTLYSTEASSQCIRAMVYLALLARPGAPIVAARNVHKAFVYAAALCGADVVWLWPERRDSLCACAVSPEALEQTLKTLPAPPAAVYVTSPDYLGSMADLPALAAVCKQYETPLLVDNAHGAYLKFLPRSAHPLDLGAAMCCDSAHKTLPVLTGGAWLHVAKGAPAAFRENARQAMAIFGSTSPSWLTLASLDLCNRYLSEDYPVRLAETVRRLDGLKTGLRERGWIVETSDPLRLTLRGDGFAIAERLRRGGVEPEYADRDFCVLMASPGNPQSHLDRVADALGENDLPPRRPVPLCMNPPERVCSVREAVFAPRETVPLEKALGRVCAGIPAACPPAIPVCVPGERLDRDALALLRALGHRSVEVLTER